MTATALDRRIEEALGDEPEGGCEPHVFLEFDVPTAQVVVDALRWALYGGAQPPDGRRALVLVLDAIQQGLAGPS